MDEDHLNLAYDQLLAENFDEGRFSEAGGLFYKENEEQRAGVVEFQTDEVYSGQMALKLSVRPIHRYNPYVPCERAEIWERPDLRVPYDKEVWFGFAMKFADPIPQDDHRYIVAQWKREIGEHAKGDYSPFLALRLRNGKLFATVETSFIDAGAVTSATDSNQENRLNSTPVWIRSEKNQMRALVAADKSWIDQDGPEFNCYATAIRTIDRGGRLPSADSGWNDFVFMTRPGPSGNGEIEIFVNGEWVVSVKGHIGHDDAGLGRHQYFKFGPYRDCNDGVWTMYYDCFRRSLKREEVLPVDMSRSGHLGKLGEPTPE